MEETTINKTEVINYLKHLNESKIIKIEGSDKERLIFINSQEVFKIFGSEDKEVLDPFNDYTYEWLNSFLYNVIDFINYNNFDSFEELEENIRERSLFEWVDSEVDVYTHDLTQWLASNNSNTYYLEEAIKENPNADNHLMLAQYKAIEEVYENALNVLIEDLKNEFEE